MRIQVLGAETWRLRAIALLGERHTRLVETLLAGIAVVVGTTAGHAVVRLAYLVRSAFRVRNALRGPAQPDVFDANFAGRTLRVSSTPRVDTALYGERREPPRQDDEQWTMFTKPAFLHSHG